jgi:hypothetical protein
LQRCRNGFQSLFPADNSSALEQLAAVLAQYGTSDEVPREDDIEPGGTLRHDELEELYRNGMVSILEHDELSAVARIRAVMNWTAFWLVLIQHARASASLGLAPSVLVCDCGAAQPQLRRASQKCLKDIQTMIVAAADNAAGGAGKLRRQQTNRLRGFFWATAATIKLLNAWRGRRHFTLGLDVLETLVLAATQKAREQTFEAFVDSWLFEGCRLVVGRAAAEKAGLLGSIDSSIFEDNENRLASQMRAAGLLKEYSDATRMVGTEGLT